MPTFVRAALARCKLMSAYCERPPYQQNDHLGWIIRAKLEPTRQRRFVQMLDELTSGDQYMKMAYRPKRSDTKPVVKLGFTSLHEAEQ
jgi:Bacteriocin-protection, YdeI or OmpD-Associated